MLSNWYVNGALQHWRGAVAPGAIDDHEGGYYDPATKVWATVTRVNAATIYDPATGRIHDVRAGYIPQNPWSSYYTGGKGYAPFPEELRSNVCAYSYFTSQADVDQWSMTASGTATIGTSGIYMKSLGATLVADASGNRAFWRTITSTAATRPLSVFIRASAAPTSADCQLCAVVGSGDPVGTLLTTTFTDLGGGVYRAKATYTGTAATWAIGLAVKADKTVFVDAFQDETGGAHHTSYIPTVASTATRNGVSITGPTTGFTAAGMTFMAVLGTPTAGITAEVMTWEAQTGTDFARLYMSGGLGYLRVKTADSDSAGNTATAMSTPGILTGVWPNGDAKAQCYANGVAKNAGNAITTPPANLKTTFNIGSFNNTLHTHGPINQLVIFVGYKTPAYALALQYLIDGVAESRIPMLIAADII